MCAIEFDAKYSKYISEEQWNSYTDTQKEQFKKMITDAEKGALSEGLSGPKKTGMTGVTLEKAEGWVKFDSSGIPLAENKELQDIKIQQNKHKILERYEKNPSEADNDIIELFYRKEAKQIEGGLRKLAQEDPVLIKDKYLKEFASQEEVDAYNDAYAKKLEQYKKNPDEAKKYYNAEFTKKNKNNYIKENQDITDEQIDRIAKRKALIDEFSIGNDQYEKMSKKVITDRYLNKATNVLEDYNKKIAEAEASGDTKKVEKLKLKAAEAVKDEKLKETKDRKINIENAAQMLAEAQVDIEIAKEKFNKTQVHWDKNGNVNDKDGKNHTYLNDEMRQWVSKHPDLFAKDGSDAKEVNAENFDSQKFKEYMLAASNEHEVDQDGKKDVYNQADFYGDIRNRKELIDKKYDADIDAKLKDRRFAGKAFKAAGLDIETDRTVGKRLGHVGLGVAKGAGIGGAAALLAEALSTTKVLNKDYMGMVQYAGTQAYSGKVGFKGEVGYSGSVGYEASGTVQTTNTFVTENWENGYLVGKQTTEIAKDVPWNTSGEVGYSGTVGYEGEKEYKGEVDYKGEKEYSGMTSARNEINWSNVAKGAILGGISGGITAGITSRKIYDEGRRQYAVARDIAAEKMPDEKPAQRPPLKLEPLKPAPLNLQPAKKDEYAFDMMSVPGIRANVDYKIRKGDYPSGIITSKYGITMDNPDYKKVMEEVYKASGYEKNTNLKVGDKFTLPVVVVGDKVYKADITNDTNKAEVVDNGLNLGKLKQYQVKFVGGGWYVMDVSDTKAMKRVSGLLPTKEAAQEEIARLSAEAEKAGKVPKQK